MAQLYSISFTTRTLVRKFDNKGREVSSSQLDNPVTLTALPYATAMSYQIADNFKIERYEPTPSRQSSGRSSSIGNGTKKVQRPPAPQVAAAKKSQAGSTINSAAASGNLGAAFNV